MAAIEKKAVVLLSGGLDSTTILYHALSKNFDISCLMFDYGQRHAKELQQARSIAKLNQLAVHTIALALPWGGSSLIDQSEPLPDQLPESLDQIPSTYVPARNIIFLSYATSFAEAIGACDIFIGANAIDYSGYPDCRPDFMKTFESAINLGTRSGVLQTPLTIHTPLIEMTKAEIIRYGLSLKTPYEKTWSCYQGGERPCGVCDSCRLRAKGFAEVGLSDPALG